MSTETQADIDIAIGTEATRFLPMATLSVQLCGPEISTRDPVFGVIANMSTTGAYLITNRGLPKNTVAKLSISAKALGKRSHPSRADRLVRAAARAREGDRRLFNRGRLRHGIGSGDRKHFVDRVVSAGLVIAQRLPRATSFVSKYSSSPSCPDSAPMPLCFQPGKGASVAIGAHSLTPTIPNSSLS